MFIQKKKARQEADLDITPFMNLMIVLVPVLLLSMVFTRITVIDIQLPASAGESAEQISQKQIEVVIKDAEILVNFPEGTLLRSINNKVDGTPDYDNVSLVLQALKRELQIKGADRKNLTLLVSESIPYHKVISTMDAVRSYSAVVVTDVVDAELFPDIAFGDAPVSADLAVFDGIPYKYLVVAVEANNEATIETTVEMNRRARS
ncbi:MAG: biopolymer transporter ExbD [Pseudomonadales bacterium]